MLNDYQEKTLQSLGFKSLLYQRIRPPERYTSLIIGFKIGFAHSLENIKVPADYRYYDGPASKEKNLAVNLNYKNLECLV